MFVVSCGSRNRSRSRSRSLLPAVTLRIGQVQRHLIAAAASAEAVSTLSAGFHLHKEEVASRAHVI